MSFPQNGDVSIWINEIHIERGVIHFLMQEKPLHLSEK